MGHFRFGTALQAPALNRQKCLTDWFSSVITEVRLNGSLALRSKRAGRSVVFKPMRSEA